MPDQGDKMSLLQFGFKKYCEIQRRFNLNNLPPLIIWEPTLACNFKCKFCGFYGEGGAPPDLRKELIREDVDKTLKMWEDIILCYWPRKPIVGITGGEPFSVKDLSKFLDLFKREKIKYSITSNGYLINEEWCKQLKETGCTQVRISLHGLVNIHNNLVQIPNAYERVIKNIKLLKNHKIDVLINCVITNENFPQLEQLVLLAKELSVNIRFQHLEWLTPEVRQIHGEFTANIFGCDLPVKYGFSNLNDTAIVKVKEFVSQNKGKVLFEPDLKLEEIDDYYRRWSYAHCSKCYQPWGVARLDPYGNVYPCIDYYFGNLKESDFDKIWNGNKTRLFKNELKKYGLFPGCRRCCKI